MTSTFMRLVHDVYSALQVDCTTNLIPNCVFCWKINKTSMFAQICIGHLPPTLGALREMAGIFLERVHPQFDLHPSAGWVCITQTHVHMDTFCYARTRRPHCIAEKSRGAHYLIITRCSFTLRARHARPVGTVICCGRRLVDCAIRKPLSTCNHGLTTLANILKDRACCK
jgi:hypothetical protein